MNSLLYRNETLYQLSYLVLVKDAHALQRRGWPHFNLQLAVVSVYTNCFNITKVYTVHTMNSEGRLQRFYTLFRQTLGSKSSKTEKLKLWQHQYYTHILYIRH